MPRLGYPATLIADVFSSAAPSAIDGSSRHPVTVLVSMVLLVASLSHLLPGVAVSGWTIARLGAESLFGVALLIPACAVRLRPAAALLFAAFAGFNLLAALAGRGDCGCFAFPVPPLITAAIDIVLAAALWRGPAPAAVAAAAVAAVAVAVLATSPTGAAPRVLIGQRVATLGDDPNALVVVTRSRCDACARVLPMMLLVHGAAARMPPVRLLDLSEPGTAGALAHLTRPADAESARVLRAAPAPCVVHIHDGVIQEIETWPVSVE